MKPTKEDDLAMTASWFGIGEDAIHIEGSTYERGPDGVYRLADKDVKNTERIATHDLVLTHSMQDRDDRIMEFFKCRNCNCRFYGYRGFRKGLLHPAYLMTIPKCGERVTLKWALKEYWKKVDFADNIKSGLFSGFPLCCIIWYTLAKRTLVTDTIYNLYSKIHGKDDNFVRCPLCIAQGRCGHEFRHDRYCCECSSKSWVQAVASWASWKSVSQKTKEIYNECADREYERDCREKYDQHRGQ